MRSIGDSRLQMQRAILVAASEWKFLEMENSRRSQLEAVGFREIVEMIVRQGKLVAAPKPERAKDRDAPPGTLRATFTIAIPATTGDLLHNGRDGLRARYWLSPEAGEHATRHLLERLQELLFNALPPKLEIDGFVLTNDAATMALKCAFAKMWVREEQLQSGGQSLEVPRWALNEFEQDNPRLWRWTPKATIFEIKSAWFTTESGVWVAESKKKRPTQIHRWGFS